MMREMRHDETIEESPSTASAKRGFMARFRRKSNRQQPSGKRSPLSSLKNKQAGDDNRDNAPPTPSTSRGSSPREQDEEANPASSSTTNSMPAFSESLSTPQNTASSFTYNYTTSSTATPSVTSSSKHVEDLKSVGATTAASSSKKKLPLRTEVKLEKAPTAREAAFGGPPRYDWIDIETAAAVKVQSAYRRNKVLKDLEEHGLSTAAIRNRSRRRKVRRDFIGTDDIPSLFRCCGVGLAFGGEEQDGYEDIRANEKYLYEERKKARQEQEIEMASQYRKQLNRRRAQQNPLEEAYEIVD